LAAAAAAVALILAAPRPEAFAPLVARYDEVADLAAALDIRSEDLAAIERHWDAQGGLPSHVVDLAEAGFRPVGGALRAVAGRRARLTVYRDGRHVVVCDFRFASAYHGPLPASGDPLFFSSGGLSFCVRRMGDAVCVLFSRMPLGEFRTRLVGA
jgi:anti-sigma factor RsiW